jgi:hypothetical protein
MSAGTVHAVYTPPDQLSVTANNVTELEFFPNQIPFASPSPQQLRITVNGAERTFPVGDERPITWQVSKRDRNASAKSAVVEGPVSHVFAEPFMVVEPSQGNAVELKVAKDLAEQIQDAWHHDYYTDCPRKLDSELAPADLATMNLVLVGGPSVNAFTQRIAPYLPFRIDDHGITKGDRVFPGSHLILVTAFPNPMNPAHYVAIVATNSPEKIVLPDPDLAHTATYDFAVWRVEATHNTVLLGKYLWDDSWKQLWPDDSIAGNLGFLWRAVGWRH